jgi:LysM repeat protein
MVGRTVRLLAPIAIIAVAVSVYLVVHATVDNHHTVTKTRTGVNAAKAHHRHKHARREAQYYVVRPGDTLSGIATRTGISLTTLEQLNPNISPNALQTGERLRLRR